MPDLKYLHNETLKLRRKAHERLDAAFTSTVKALQYNRATDFKKASEESSNANYLLSEAVQLEQEALEIDHQIADLEQKALDIDRQVTDMQQSIHSKLELLDRMKRTIIGNF